MKTYPLPIYVQRFFTERLATQLHASPNTIASYRDAFRLLLKSYQPNLITAPQTLNVDPFRRPASSAFPDETSSS